MALGSSTPQNDISVKIISRLWSDNWHNIGVDPNVSIAQNDASYFIYDAMNFFNTVVLAVVVVMMIWTTWSAVTGTAHEGVPLGRRFSTIWVPFRAAVGISFLAPIFSGLSILQIIILQLIVWSINLANVVNTKMFNDFISAGPSGNISIAVNIGSIPGLSENGQNVARVIFRALTIQEYYKDVKNKGLQDGGSSDPYSQSVSGNNLKTEYEFFAPDINIFNNFLAGDIMANTVVICDVAGSAVCNAKNEAMQKLISDLGPIANDYVALKDESLSTTATLDNINTRYHSAVVTYITALEGAILGNMDPSSEFATQTANFKATAGDGGWLTTGAYYWILSNAANKALAEAAQLPKAKMADLNFLEKWSIATGNIEKILEASDPITSTTDYLHENIETFGPEDSFIYNFLSWPADKVVEWFLSSLAGADANASKDVITNLQVVGHQIIFAGNTVMTGLYFNDTIRNKVTKMINAATGGSLFSKAKNEDEPGVLAMLVIKLLLMGLVVLFLIYPMGIMLAFYLPMIPFIIWIIAGINWAISTITLMVGAPLWAAAHSLPEGEGFAGARGQEGYMILLNVILRPTLMIIGFFVAFIGIRMLGIFLFELFMIAQSAMNANFSRGLVTILVMIFMFGMIVIVCAQKIFSLIVLFPDIILNFVGKYLPGGGESSDVHRVNAMFDHAKSHATPRLPGR